MKTPKFTRQRRSQNHSPIDTEASKLAASIAQSHAPDADSAEQTSDWPSQSVAESMLDEVLQHLKRVREILTTIGLRAVGDPLNRVGDRQSWIVIVEPTERMSTGIDTMGLARSILNDAGIANDPYRLDSQDAGDRSFRIAIASPLKAAIPVLVSAPLMNVASEDLQKGYGIDPAPLPSNRAIIEEYREAHNGEEPSMEHMFGKLLKRAREYSVGHVPGTLPPKTPPSESEIASAPLSVSHQHPLADKSGNVQMVNGVRMLEIHNGDVADTIRMTYPALRDAVKMARAWVQAKPKETRPADVRSAYPILEIANDDEIEQHVIRLPKDQSDRFVAIEMLRRHTPGNYTKSSIERMTHSLIHRKRQPIRAVQTTDSPS